MLKIIVILQLVLLFSQEPLFFKNLEKMSSDSQKEVLEKRILMDGRMDSRLTTSRNTRVYLEKFNKEGKGVLFLFEAIKMSGHSSFKVETFAELLDSIGLDESLTQLNKIIGTMDGGSSKVLRRKMLSKIKNEADIDMLIQNRDNIVKLIELSEPHKGDGFPEDAFFLAFQFGLTESISKLRPTFKTLTSPSPELQSVNCYSYLEGREFAKAESCFSSLGGARGDRGLLFSKKVQGLSQVEILKEFEKYRNKHKKHLKKQAVRDLAFQYYVTETLGEDEQNFLMKQKIDYKNGFIILLLDQKHQALQKEKSALLTKNYSGRFPNSIFQKILEKKISKEQLKSWFGQASFFYQSAR